MALNDLVEKDPYEIPTIRDIVRATQGSNWFSVIDLKEGFYHVEIEESDKHKTAFEFDGRVYEWCSMVMGFKNSPQILQRTMNRILDDLRGRGVEVYLDDIIIHSRDHKNHDSLLEEILKRFKENKMRINPKKIQYKQGEVKLLGVVIDGKTQKPLEIKKNEALEYKRPENLKEMRRFLGLVGWFRNFIKGYV
jgi:Reverse transcriptase (RNA-dependent DNA polymerase)